MKASALFGILFAALVAAGGELDIAREALRDGLWEVARAHATFAGDLPAAKLVILESLAGEDKWDAVAEMLQKWPDEKTAPFEYYRAVVRGDHAAAAALLKSGGSADGILEARLHEAEALYRAGKRDEAKEIWREVGSQTNASDRVLSLAGANLMEPAFLERAYALTRSTSLRREVGLRLGMARLRDPATAESGESLIRKLVKDAPDTPHAMEAFLAIADRNVSEGKWAQAMDAYREAVETWPRSAKLAAVQENRGWALQKLGRREEAIEAFRTAGALAEDDDARARALLKEGDLLAEAGRTDESMDKYREVTEKFPKTTVAEMLKTVIRLRDLEARGRRLYAEYKFDEAMSVFAQVGEEDSSRRQRMSFFRALCLYGQGLDEKAEREIRQLVESCPDSAVRSDALLWLAKYLYNRRGWKEAGRLFLAYTEMPVEAEAAASALLWAARAALADGDFQQAIQLSTKLSEKHPDSSSRAAALLVQGEALVELARFDEAILLFERVPLSEAATADDRLRALMLKADALFVMGADNPVRYAAALAAYRAVLSDGSVDQDLHLVVSFKIARCLEKLKRLDEAIDQYYVHVVLAYRNGRLRGSRFSDEARAVFSRAGFWLADEYEGRGKDRQALSVLELVAESDVPAAQEARKRIIRILRKGDFL